MKKIMNKKLLALCTAATMVCMLPLAASAADKLTVKNPAETETVFTVDDAGTVYAADKLGVGVVPNLYPFEVSDISDSFYTAFASYGIEASRAHTAVNGCPNWQTYRSRGTASTPTVVLSQDRVGKFNFKGYSEAAGAYLSAVWLSAEIDGEPDSGGDTTDMPGRIIFYTSADGSATPTEKLRISSDGTMKVADLQGPYTNGSAFVCVDDDGVLYASETSCP